MTSFLFASTWSFSHIYFREPGILWTGQGSYYAINAQKYSASIPDASDIEVSSNFAGMFAAFYLFAEAVFKAIATGIYVIKEMNFSWLAVVFGFYTAAAFLSTELFRYLVLYLYDDR